MPRSRQFAIALAAMLLLAGCHRKPAPTPASTAFVLADAMQHWYGRYDTSTQTARANLPEHPTLDLTGTDFAPNDPVDISVILDAAYLQAGRPRHAIVTAAVPHRSDKPGRPGDESFHCLTCRPVIGVAVFTLRKNAWLLESENAAAALAGSNGRAPDARLIDLGTDIHGIRLDATMQANDFTSSTMSLLAPWHEQVMLAFSAETAHSNRGACGEQSPLRDACYAWQRADAFAAVPGQDYDDLTLTSSGTKPAPEAPLATAPNRAHAKGTPQPQQVVPFIGVERYRFRNGKYLTFSDTDGSPVP